MSTRKQILEVFLSQVQPINKAPSDSPYADMLYRGPRNTVGSVVNAPFPKQEASKVPAVQFAHGVYRRRSS